tara:strand:- start:3945 stop:4580 length:636 start_codon:yes stop_codon:yes gene_type:complete
MKTNDFKLLIEGFNNYLLNEHMGHTQKCTDLLSKVPAEFQPYVNDTLSWYNGDAWLTETDHGGDQDSEDDEKLLFEEVAKACGCKVDELLVNFVDTFVDEIDYGTPSGPAASFGQYQPNPQVRADDFLVSYRPSSNLCGSFQINGESLKGFYYQLGSTCGLEFQFKSQMSERTLKGLLFVAPTCSGSSSSTSSDQSKPRFKGVLGSKFSPK